jgi:Fic family protein
LESRTIRNLAAAADAVGRLAGTAGRVLNPWLIGAPLLRREAILSSRIEGTITTPEELVLLEAGGAPTRARSRPEDTREVLNYIKAMEHGLDLLKTLPVCLRLIEAVHGKLLEGVRGHGERPGEFRTTQNWIGYRSDDPITAARYVPPPATRMRDCLRDFEQYLNLPSDSVHADEELSCGWR